MPCREYSGCTLQPELPGTGFKAMALTQVFKSLTAATLLLAAPALAQAQELSETYKYESARVPVGQVLHYRKSRQDGSHAAQVSVYVASTDRIEVLKWDRGGDQATLVIALMDWRRFSVHSFEAWHLSATVQPERRATLSVAGDELRMSLMPQPLTLHHWPWHSYDFDFTSLALTLPHRLDPTRDLTFWRTDFVYSDPPAVAEIGELTLRYLRRERHGRVPAWRYSLGGAGLGGQSGDWWVDRRTGLTLEYRLPVGDEPGYDNVVFKLESRQPMTPAGWQAFKARSVSAAN
jgi:hypothetical protein